MSSNYHNNTVLFRSATSLKSFGTSLKDLVKCWFSFNKMEMTAKELMEKM